MTIRYFSTGGTFEKVYDPIKGQLTFKTSHLEALITRANLFPKPAWEVLMLVDSLEMTHAQREQICQAVSSCNESSIVIVHGTDTMVDTAEVLEKAAIKKTIVLTGAMVPFSVSQSDAVFNLGFAHAACQLQAHGVYVAMNGVLHQASQVIKNRTQGVFTAKPLGSI